MNKIFAFLLTAMSLTVNAQTNNDGLPATLPPIPEIPEKEPVGTVKMSDWQSFQEVQLDLPLTAGPFKPNWTSIEKNYPGTPQWLRDAKFGIWVHFGPQAAGESGDWYARNLITSDNLNQLPDIHVVCTKLVGHLVGHLVGCLFGC